MRLNTVIFDMDGLLIDSEPLWYEAAYEVFVAYGIQLTPKEYATTTGLRTKEFIQWWFQRFNIQGVDAGAVDKAITTAVIDKIQTKGKTLPGVAHVLNYFIQQKFKIGLASSSDMSIIDVVVNKLGIREHISVIESAEKLEFGKPHPQVYLNCAAALKSSPIECLCFEDSFNGMIAAKAARMKCIVVPAKSESQHPKFGAADLRLSSLINFNGLLLEALD
ncbi:MAG: hexitol phosphatase HxpB [Bacteroidota bacterium]